MSGDDTCVIQCYGITKDPETNNFMMVMEYAEHGSLRQNINKNFNSKDWNTKFGSLCCISDGLKYNMMVVILLI